MALKRCPECRKKVADTCDTCIHCGYKFKKYTNSNSKASDDDYYKAAHTDYGYDKEERERPLLRLLGIILGSIVAAAAVALLIYTFIKHEQIGFSTSAIMEAVSVVAFVGGATAAVLCHRLL